MHLLHWTKWSHESTNFDTFKCSEENLAISLCHFPNHEPVFLQILHDSSVLLKIAPLYFFSSNVIYYAQKGQITEQILENWVLGWKFTKFLSFLKHKIGFSSNFAPLSIIRHNPSVLFGWNFRYFQQKEPIKVQIWWNFTCAAESLKFCFLMGSCYKHHIKF